MTIAHPEQEVRHHHEVEEMGLEAWDIPCDIPARTRAHNIPGYPKCKGESARWVAWRANCCPGSPRYLLVCDFCKDVYQRWIARDAYIACGDCGEYTGGFVKFTELWGGAA